MGWGDQVSRLLLRYERMHRQYQGHGVLTPEMQIKTSTDYSFIEVGKVSVDGVYKLMSGWDAYNKQELWILYPKQQGLSEGLLYSLCRAPCYYLVRPENIYATEKGLLMTFPKTQAYPHELTQVTEAQLWEWLGQMAVTIQQLCDASLMVDTLDPQLVTIERYTNKLQFFSYTGFGAQTAQRPTDMLLKFAEHLTNRCQLSTRVYSRPFRMLLANLRSAVNPITMSQLLAHPLLAQYTPHYLLAPNKSFSLSDFKHIRELGAGAYGRADLVQYLPSMEHCVLKSTTNTKAQDLEVSALQALSHPSIVRFYGAFCENRTYYIVMQYCNGGDLFDRLTDGKNADTGAVKQWISQLCSAIYHMHDQRIMHRDIKPQNILLHDRRAMLADFGVSRAILDEYAETVVGTPLYFSPEQHFHLGYTIEADIFSLGLVFFNMVVGSHLFGPRREEIDKFYNYCKKHGSAVGYLKYIYDEELSGMIGKMLVFDPSKRIKAAELCRCKFVEEYILENDLPGPQSCTLLVSQHLVYKGQEVINFLNLNQTLQQSIISKYKYMEPQCGQYVQQCVDLLPYYYLSKLGRERETVLTNPYLEYVVRGSIQETYLQLQQYLHSTVTLRELPGELRGQNVTICGSEYRIELYSMLQQVYSDTKGLMICMAPALCLNQDVSIRCRRLVLVCGHLIAYRACTISIECESALVGFQRHNGAPVTICGGQGTCFYNDQNATAGIVPKNIKYRDFDFIKRTDDKPLLVFVYLCNYSFPLLFAGNKGFYVGSGAWA